MAPSNDIIAFYEGKAEGNGRSLEQILKWPATKLESCHDYIQTLFPLPERSVFNDPAPIIDEEVFDAFQSRKELRGRLGDSFQRMLWFYGFQLITDTDGTLEVRPGPTCHQHSPNWNIRRDHNHLRMTRIIRCLRILGLEEEAQAFYRAIVKSEVVGLTSRMYWTRAATRPLNIAPNIGQTGSVKESYLLGPEFLQRFEREKSLEIGMSCTARAGDET